jgi:hypothetical protein
MRRLLLFTAFTLGAFRLCAFQAVDTHVKAKPTPKQKAAELLNAVLDSAPGAQPEVAATALARAAENLEALDRKKSLDAVRQAFAVSRGIPPADDARRERVQVIVVASAAQVSLPDAVEMLKQVQPPPGDYDPRQGALDRLVEKTLEKKEFSEAIELLNAVGAVGQYPYSAAGKIYEALPKGDARREAVFGAALAAYGLRPAEPFSEFVSKHWKDLPQTMAEASVSAIVSHILSYKSDESLVETISASKGSITLRTRQDVELFNVMHLLREFDSKRADEILETHPELKAAVARFPNGETDMGMVTNTTRGQDVDALESAVAGQGQTQAASVMEKVGKLFENENDSDEVQMKHFMTAMDLIRGISDPAIRANMLADMAAATAEDEPEIAKKIIGESAAAAKDVTDPLARVDLWSKLGEAAHAIKDDKLTGEAFDHALDEASELLKTDTNPDNPNRALRDEWPSTHACRKTVIGVTKAFGVDAEWILARISDPDEAVYARVEMAQTLLDRPHQTWVISRSFAK